MKVPFNNLYLQYLNLKKEIDSAFEDVIKSSSFIRGSYVEKFEEEFSRKIGSKYCISCGNGTDALYISLKALDVDEGSEVIVPAHSWISTSEVVTQAGGKVVFCDTNENTFDINHKEIEKWKIQNSLLQTLAKRPDLLDKKKLSKKQKNYQEKTGQLPEKKQKNY